MSLLDTEAQWAATPQSQMGSLGLVHYFGSTDIGNLAGKMVDHLSI